LKVGIAVLNSDHVPGQKPLAVHERGKHAPRRGRRLDGRLNRLIFICHGRLYLFQFHSEAAGRNEVSQTRLKPNQPRHGAKEAADAEFLAGRLPAPAGSTMRGEPYRLAPASNRVFAKRFVEPKLIRTSLKRNGDTLALREIDPATRPVGRYQAKH
jgi:hypothetical protein